MKLIAVTPEKKYDYTTSQIVEGLISLGHHITATSSGNGIDYSCQDDDFIKESKSADAALFFFGKVRDNNPPRHYLVDKIKTPFEKRAYIDGSEWTFTGHQTQNQINMSMIDEACRRGEPWINNDMKEKCKFYFKRETYKIDQEKGIIPLPFGMSKNHILKEKNKDIDVFCVFGHVKTGLRQKVVDYCNSLSKNSNFNVVVSSDIPKNEYQDLLSRSRIVIDCWGGGDTCDRFYEAIGAKSCCLYQKYNVIVPNQFVDWQHAVSFKDMNEFDFSMQKLLSSKKITQEIGKQGFHHALQWHTVEQRAHTILEKLK